MTKNEDKKQIWTEGVKDIKTWAEKFDKSEEWKTPRNKQLQESMKNGFSITRGKDTAFVGIKEARERKEGKGKWEKEDFRKWWRKQLEEEIRFSNKEDGEYLYQNTGILTGNGAKESCKGCGQAEKYFPLDIAVLGDQTKLRNLSDWYGNLVQELEVKDNITQVIGVRLDQVVISETGIGDGKGD